MPCQISAQSEHSYNNEHNSRDEKSTSIMPNCELLSDNEVVNTENSDSSIKESPIVSSNSDLSSSRDRIDNKKDSPSNAHPPEQTSRSGRRISWKKNDIYHYY